MFINSLITALLAKKSSLTVQQVNLSTFPSHCIDQNVNWDRKERMRLFSELDVWMDPVARSGAENMAVDQLLYQSELSCPLIRFYRWSEPTVSFGYFEKLEDAKNAFGDERLTFVRRLTGGGIVDHREDLTYSLFVPKGHAVEQIRGNKIYEAVHEVLAESLVQVGVGVQLIGSDSQSESRACFDNPVAHDVIDATGKKLAGAGQKRTRHGLLHQGSVLVKGVDLEPWARLFVALLGETITERNDVHLSGVGDLVNTRYGSVGWTAKR